MKENRYEVVYSRPSAGIIDMRIFTSLEELSEWMNRQNNQLSDRVIITDIRPFV